MPKRKPRKSSKAQRKVTKKKPVKRRSSGKKKQNPWLKHVNAVLKELKKENPKASLRDAIPIAKKSYKKGQAADSWNVSTSKYSTVSMPKKKDSWNVPTDDYSVVSMPKKKGEKKSKKKGKNSNTSVLTNQTDKFDSFLDGIEY